MISLTKKIAVIILVFTGYLLQGQVNKASSEIIGSAIIVSNTPTIVEGNRYATSKVIDIASRGYYTERAHALVTLSSELLKEGTLTGASSASVLVEITYEEEVFGAYKSTTTTQLLKLESDDDKIIDASYFKAEGAEKCSVVIKSVNIPSDWPEVKLEIAVFTESFSTLKLANITAITSPLTHEGETSDGNLKISWGDVQDANHYELEWTYISDQGATVSDELTLSDIEIDRFLFRNNSSRVEVVGNSYEIPLIYEKGIVLFRLRGVGNRIANGKVVLAKTAWTVPDGKFGDMQTFSDAAVATGGLNHFKFTGHEMNLNWQGSIVFAEEGKHKASIAYHDGSLRNRQALTRVNTDKRAVIGETFYDYNGRDKIQILPVPVTDNSIEYRPHFNVVEGTTKVDKNQYDTDEEGNICSDQSIKLDVQKGAANYYSPNNQFSQSVDNDKNEGGEMINRDLLPDAKKYPYTNKDYTPDNTGRVKSLSGVGEAHHLYSGHQTSNYYGSPQQVELTRIFGNQVGYDVHYKKEVVVDPNGQVSASYKNMSGKVILTALTGSEMGNLKPLDGDASKTINSNLFGLNDEKNTLTTDGLKKIYSSKFSVVSKVGNQKPYIFQYNATIQPYQVICDYDPAAVEDFNMDGIVDIEIQLIDQCGGVKYNGKVSTVKTGTSTDSKSPQDVSLFDGNAIDLDGGEYQLVKRLSLNEAALDAYWEDYLTKDGTCFKSRADFLKDEEKDIDATGCNLDCETCQDAVDKLNAEDPLITPEEAARREALCDDICDKPIGCNSYIASMGGDLAPNGQYGLLRKNDVSFSKEFKVEIDEFGDPVYEEPSVDIGNINEDGFADVDNEQSSKVTPELFPLSIYNNKNSLPLQSKVLDVLTVDGTMDVATWRVPLKINVDGYTKENSKNEVLFDDAPSTQWTNITLKETNYRNEAGEIHFVEVYKFKDGTYSPEIVEEINGTTITGINDIVARESNLDDKDEITLSKITVQSGDDFPYNIYKIPVKYLKNPEDFEFAWKDFWGNYLLPYHPEYQYLIECKKEVQSYNFDYNLSKTANEMDAISAGYLIPSDPNWKPEDGTSPNAYSNILNLDPYNTGGLKSSYLNHIVTKYRVNPSNQSDYTSMIEMANQIAHCGGEADQDQSTGCSNADAQCQDDKIDSQGEWNILKALYLSEKQKILKWDATQKSVEDFYYNGCIGDEDFLTTPEALAFKKTQIIKSLAYRRFTPVVTLANSIFKGVWGRPNRLISWTINKSVPAYLNPSQVCFVDRSDLFKDKDKRFFPNISTNSIGGQMSSSCFKQVTVDNNNTPLDYSDDTFEYIPEPCESEIKEQTQKGVEVAQKVQYEKCGLCPSAFDFQSLISQLNTNGFLATIDDQNPLAEINGSQSFCSDDVVKLGPALFKLLTKDESAPINLSLETTISSGHKSAKVSVLQNGINKLLELTLTLPANDNSDDPQPLSNAITILNLNSICCLEFDTDGENFEMEGTYVDATANSQTKFTIAGKISLGVKIINDCDIKPKCLLTEDSKRISRFLNSLCVSKSIGASLVNELFTDNAPVELDAPDNIVYYTHSVLGLLQEDGELDGFITVGDENQTSVPSITSLNPRWTSTKNTSTNSLQGTFSSTSGNVVLYLKFQDNTMVFNNILGFSSIQVEDGVSDHFIANAIISDGTGGVYYKKVEISSDHLNPVACKAIKN